MCDVNYTTVRIIVLCILWYITSAGNNVIGKLLLQSFAYPITVTMVQLLSITVYSMPAFLFIAAPKRVPNIEWSYYVKHIIPLSIAHLFASLLSHVSLWSVSVSFAHTVKASMPLFVVILSRLILGENQTIKVYISLVPIILGILVATVTELEFNAIGLVSALFSTFLMALQNIFSKKTLTETPIHYLILLHLLSRFAFLMIIPFWLWHDANQIFLAENKTLTDQWFIVCLLFLDGLAVFLQNVISSTVLSLVTPLTYSVCNASKRIAVITCSIIMLKNPVTPLNVAGMAMAIFGVFYYNKAKYDANRERSVKKNY